MTFHELKWSWRHEERSLVAIFRFRVSILPVNRCLRVFGMVFVQNRRFSIFSQWHKMERSQKRRHAAPPFSGNLETKRRCGVSRALPPIRAKVNRSKGWLYPSNILKFMIQTRRYVSLCYFVGTISEYVRINLILTRRPLGLRAVRRPLGGGI